MTIDAQTLEMYANLAAAQLVNQYVPYARSLGLTPEETKALIKRTAEIAVRILDSRTT